MEHDSDLVLLRHEAISQRGSEAISRAGLRDRGLSERWIRSLRRKGALQLQARGQGSGLRIEDEEVPRGPYHREEELLFPLRQQT